LLRVWPSLLRSPKAPTSRYWMAWKGFFPRTTMMMQPSTKASSTEITGTAKFRSLPTWMPPLDLVFSMLPPSLSGHGQADFFDGRIGTGVLAEDLPFKHHENPVGHLENLVKVRRDQKH